MTDLVTIDIQNHVADVRLNRADKFNALSWEMFDAITAAGHSLAEDKSIRAVVLSGEGAHFCAGMDVANFSGQTMTEAPFGPGRGGFWPNYYQAPAHVWKTLPVPVICALQGVAYGGGFQIAMAADIRIANPDTRLSLKEISWGIIPDMTASQTLKGLVRIDVAKELSFTGRVVESEEALRLGLVTRIHANPHSAAMDMARTISGQNPDAITGIKYLYEHADDGDELAGLRLEEKLQEKIIGTGNQFEAVMAAMEKRPANFAERAITTFEDFGEL